MLNLHTAHPNTPTWWNLLPLLTAHATARARLRPHTPVANAWGHIAAWLWGCWQAHWLGPSWSLLFRWLLSFCQQALCSQQLTLHTLLVQHIFQAAHNRLLVCTLQCCLHVCELLLLCCGFGGPDALEGNLLHMPHCSGKWDGQQALGWLAGSTISRLTEPQGASPKNVLYTVRCAHGLSPHQLSMEPLANHHAGKSVRCELN